VRRYLSSGFNFSVNSDHGGQKVNVVQDTRLRAPRYAVVAAWAMIVGGWIAGGAAGVIAEPLSRALIWVAVAVAVAAMWGDTGQRPSTAAFARSIALPLLAIVAGLFFPFWFPMGPAYQVFWIALVAALLAGGAEGSSRTILRVVALAVFVFGVYRLAVESIPSVWLLANGVGAWLGWIAGGLSGRDVSLGATFAGMDFLVLMIALVAVWLAMIPGRRWQRALAAATAVCGAHLIYLIVLAGSHDFVASLPEIAPPPEPDIYVPPPWNWTDAIRGLFPWNVPLIGVFLHSLVVVAIVGWSNWPVAAASGQQEKGDFHRAGREWITWVPVALAAMLPIVVVFCPVKSTLKGKRIVAFERGYLDWEVPQHDRYGQLFTGTYGMLPKFVKSLGGEFERVSEFSAEALSGADVLLLLHPVEHWTDEQLNEIWDFVRGGGSLLVVGAPRVKDGDVSSSFNRVLEPTGIRVNEDVAVGRAAGWQHGLGNLVHPVTADMDSRRQWFGVFETASIRVRWPARPAIVGRWGWGDPGSDAVLTQQARFEPGERLGDLVLAASQPLGKGRIFVLGGPNCLTNLGNVTEYPLAGRLLATLAGAPSAIDPQVWWRQVLGVAMCAGLIAVTGFGATPMRLTMAAGALMIFGVGNALINETESRVVPDGRLIAGTGTAPGSTLAYIDASHVAAYRDEKWAYDGLAGLQLALMRSGLLPMELNEVTRERLERAGVLVCIGASRVYTSNELRQIDSFVRQGGLLICMVGAEEAPASEALLSQFGLSLPKSPVRPGDVNAEAEPMGNLFTTYLNAADFDRGDYLTEVQFYTGWPVEGPGEEGEVFTYGAIKQPTITTLEGQEEQVAYLERPLVVSREIGAGRVILIGDTNFGLNKNLEYATGEPFRGRYENAHYWRWLFSRVLDREEWLPPEPPPVPTEEVAP
jgi:hypothetical protein